MKTNKILMILGIIVITVSLTLFFLFGDIWLYPMFIIFPCCISGTRSRLANRQETPNDREERPVSSGETVPFVDVDVNIHGENRKMCSKCHALIEEENLRFCPKCGNKL